MTDSVAYWTDRGSRWEMEFYDSHSSDGVEAPLMGLLATLSFQTVLDLGCGFGRVGAAVVERWPDCRYTGLDVSPDLLASAQARIPAGEFICADMAAFVPERRWDLVLAVSSLSHLRDVGNVISRMRAWGHDLVVLDWDEPGAETPYQWAHDFTSLLDCEPVRFGRLGLWHAS